MRDNTSSKAPLCGCPSHSCASSCAPVSTSRRPARRLVSSAKAAVGPPAESSRRSLTSTASTRCEAAPRARVADVADDEASSAALGLVLRRAASQHRRQVERRWTCHQVQWTPTLGAVGAAERPGIRTAA